MAAEVLSTSSLAAVQNPARSRRTFRLTNVLPRIGFAIYLLALMLPIYWLINMSLRSNEDITSSLAFWPHHPSLQKYFFIFNDPTWVHAFHGIADLCRDQHRHLGDRRAASRLCVQSLSFHRRQVSVLLAAVEPDGASGGVRHAVLQSLLRDRSVRHDLGRCVWRIACSTCRSRFGFSKVSSPACRARSTRWRRSTATRFRASSSASSCR